MSILEELYNGNIRPSEKYIKKDSDYFKINNRIVENIENFISKLNEEEKELFEKINDDILNASDISQRESFVEGFCTGAQLILEIMNYKSLNFYNI